MSDDLMIQGVQPQRVSTTPYLLGGAALGGAAGWVGSSLIKNGGSAKSYEELVKEANGNDKVELTTKKEAVEKAERELADASKAVYEGTEKEALDKAIAARDAELARLTETKEIGSKLFKPVAWDKADINLKDIDEVIVRTADDKKPKHFRTNKGVVIEADVKAEYDRLTREYNAAVSKFERGKGAADKTKLTKAQTEINNYLIRSFADNYKVKEHKLDGVFSTETDFLGRHTAEYNKAKTVANNVYKLPFPSKSSPISDKQYLSFAEELEDGVKPSDGYKAKWVQKEVDK